MRLVTRYLSPLTRSRRRLPFLLVILTLASTGLILYTVDSNRLSLTPPPVKPDAPIPSTSRPPIRRDTSVRSSTTAAVASRKVTWPVDDRGRSLKTNFLVLDLTGFFGSGANEGDRVRCPSSNAEFRWTRQQSRSNEIDFLISHDAPGADGSLLNRLRLDGEQQQYSMAFIMESEVHSSTGDAWARYNFKMSYNLDDSYPEPATYFDMNVHLIDLLRAPSVAFEQKEKQADIVWIISNCNAHNGREGFIERLMKEVKIDSYGSCLNNRQGYGARMADNVDAYKKYKFVIAIENSNCADYVTEKLVKAVESGSIPIVAGRNGRPDYRRYMPAHSYINIFDYPTIKALADDLKRIASNKTLYESYLWFKKHEKDVTRLREATLDEKLKQFADVIGSNATMMVSGIAGKERSENKVCKLIRFVRQTPWQQIAAHNGTARTPSDKACLPSKHITAYFDRGSSNSSSISSISRS